MAWFWSVHPAVLHAERLGVEQRFVSQGEAESWLGEFYPELMDAGVQSVSLYEEDRLVYGPMRLEPEVS